MFETQIIALVEKCLGLLQKSTSVNSEKYHELENDFDRIRGGYEAPKNKGIPVTSFSIGDVKHLFDVKPRDSSEQTWHRVNEISHIDIPHMGIFVL